MNDITRRLTALKQAWQSIENIPDDLTALGLPGKDGQFIENVIDNLSYMAVKLTSVPADSLVMIKSSCEAHLQPLEAFFFEGISGHPSMEMLTFVTLLQQLQSSLREAVIEHDLTLSGRFHHDPSQAA